MKIGQITYLEVCGNFLKKEKELYFHSNFGIETSKAVELSCGTSITSIETYHGADVNDIQSVHFICDGRFDCHRADISGHDQSTALQSPTPLSPTETQNA